MLFRSNDYPALFTLSGQFKGKVGCTVCIETAYVSLTASKKIVYMRHRRFLLEGHMYRMRKMDKYFDNNGELHSTAPSGNNKGHRVFEIVNNIKFVFGKKTKGGKTRKDVKPAPGAIFKKKSIFFEYLPRMFSNSAFPLSSTVSAFSFIVRQAVYTVEPAFILPNPKPTYLPCGT